MPSERRDHRITGQKLDMIVRILDVESRQAGAVVQHDAKAESGLEVPSAEYIQTVGPTRRWQACDRRGRQRPIVT